MGNSKLAVPSFASHDSRSRAGQAVAGTINPVEFEFWHSVRIPGLQIIRTNRHEHAYPAHMHDALEVIWIRSGCGRLTTRNRTFDINAGEAGLVSPNEIHSACSRPGMEYVAIFIPLSLLQQIFDGFQFLKYCRFVGSMCKNLTELKIFCVEESFERNAWSAEGASEYQQRIHHTEHTAHRLIGLLGRDVLCIMIRIHKVPQWFVTGSE